jgi:hypothetical protein
MAVGRGWGGASRRVPTTPCWLAPREGFSSLHPLFIQGGEFCLALMSLCYSTRRHLFSQSRWDAM